MQSPRRPPAKGPTIELLLCGYTPGEADRFPGILESRGLCVRLNNCPGPDSLPGQENRGAIHCALINADEKAETAQAFVTYLREHRPDTGIILASRAPPASRALAEQLRIHDLIDVADHPRLQLTIRRMYLASRIRPERSRGDKQPAPNPASPPAPAANGPTALFRPIVNLDGESRANYIIFANPGDGGDPAAPLPSRIPGNREDRRSLPLEHLLVHQAASLLATLGEKAGVHLTISPESIQDESLLSTICESLRQFNVRGSNLQFCVDAMSLHAESPGLQRFIEGVQKINCRITCRDVDISKTIPDQLSRHGVHMAQYSNALLANLEAQPERERELLDLDRRLQCSGIKTVAGRINHAEQLARLWRIGICKAWGDYLQKPQALGSGSDSSLDQEARRKKGNAG